VDWLVSELEAIGEPVDLVGHDWGGGFVCRVACLRPDLIRSWASDVAGLLHEDYVWHDFAKIWQAAGEGEAFFANQLATPRADRIAVYNSMGIMGEVAESFADAGSEEMARCVLALYRSAAQPAMREWGADAALAKVRPGLVVAAENDPFVGGPAMAHTMAGRMGATAVDLPAVGHWWMLQNPELGARTLEAFWAPSPG
jgi:pimeloyl-ACP methyl ester carboxylesterase